jgi:predicted house-cleaning noncanonical NTP pyrophosphatase (MazG superfamily)
LNKLEIEEQDLTLSQKLLLLAERYSDDKNLFYLKDMHTIILQIYDLHGVSGDVLEAYVPSLDWEGNEKEED